MKLPTMHPKLKDLHFNYKIWLETGEGENVFGDGKYRLLKAIDETGSLKAAMERLGLTYRKTWDNLKKIEQTLGFPVIESTRGGVEGGASTLTKEGKALVHAFEKFHKKYDAMIREGFGEILEDFISDF